MASRKELLSQSAAHPVDPLDFDLPWDTRYRAEPQFSWCAGRDLRRDAPAMLPADPVLSPPREGILSEVDTNGLASGNSHLEAVVHALCEVIERNALGQLAFTASYLDAQDAALRCATALRHS